MTPSRTLIWVPINLVAHRRCQVVTGATSPNVWE